MKVSKESRIFLVIATHRCNYRFCRMPFGNSVALIIFQKLMDQFLMGIETVILVKIQNSHFIDITFLISTDGPKNISIVCTYLTFVFP